MLDNLRFQKQNSKKENVPFSKVKCQRGAQISVQCAIALYVTLQTEYNISEYGTQFITQDDLESYFSEIRDMHGNNKEPNALQFNNRVSTHITLQMLKDLNFDIFSLVKEVATDFIKPHFKGSESILFPFKSLPNSHKTNQDAKHKRHNPQSILQGSSPVKGYFSTKTVSLHLLLTTYQQ